MPQHEVIISGLGAFKRELDRFIEKRSSEVTSHEKQDIFEYQVQRCGNILIDITLLV